MPIARAHSAGIRDKRGLVRHVLERCATTHRVGAVVVMADELRLTPDTFHRTTEQARRLGLHQDPDTTRLLQCINPARPRSIDHKLFTIAQERVTRFAQHLRDTNPFATPLPPPHTDGIVLGMEYETGRPVIASFGAMNRHTLISGPTGSAKTTLAHHAVVQARAQGLHVWIADPKLDAQYLAARDHDFLIIERDTPFNLLQPLAFVDRSVHIHVLTHCFAKTHYGGELTTQVLEIALRKAYAEHDVPCLADVQRIVDTLAPRGSTYAWLDAVRGVQHKMWRLRDRYGIGFQTRECKLDVLFQRSLYVPLLFQSTSDEFVFSVLAHLLFLHHHAHGIRTLDTLILYDEGLTAWSNRPTNIDHAPVLASLQVQLREMGIGMLVTTASINQTHDLLKSNAHIQVTMGATNPDDRDELSRSFRLTDLQREYLTSHLTIGQAIVQIGNDVARLVTFPNIAHNKTITNSEWNTALARATILAPHNDRVEPVRLLQAGDHGRNDEPRTAPMTPPIARRVALNQYAATLLDDVATHPYTLTTAAYDRCAMHWTQGDRAKTLLTELDFLVAHKVTTGSGRGKTGSALITTAGGWTWLGRTPPKGTRGGDSAQHAFLVHELARHIINSSIETLGADLVIPYDATEHEQLLQALTTLSGTTIALNTSDLIAVEIEVSAPTKTVPRNITRDAGFHRTIIATLPKHVTTVSRLVEHHAIVVDVLRLLDALRE